MEKIKVYFTTSSDGIIEWKEFANVETHEISVFGLSLLDKNKKTVAHFKNYLYFELCS